jgi:uncharacterized integral membrane protein
MPWRLIITLILLTLFVAFAGFNLDNTSVVSFGFAEIEMVPIFISLSIAFLLGAFFTLFFVTFGGFRKVKKDTKATKKSKDTQKLEDKNIEVGKRALFSKKPQKTNENSENQVT